MRVIILAVISLAILAGCASKQAFLRDSAPNPKKANLSVISIDISDLRENTTDREIKIPVLTWPGQSDKIRPRLTVQHKHLIDTEIRKHVTNTGVPVKIHVSIQEAYKEFSASWFSENEHVEIHIKIDIYDGIHSPFLVSAYGNSVYDMTSIDASPEYIEKMYQKAIRSGIKKAFREISKINDKINVPTKKAQQIDTKI